MTTVVTTLPGTPTAPRREHDPVFGERIPETAPQVPYRNVAARRRAWDNLANLTGFVNENSESLTAQQMLKRGDLDWDVALKPTYRYTGVGNDRRLIKANDLATVREDNDAQLGTVRKRYQVFQNREVFAFGDNIAREGKGKWVATGLQRDGARVFMVMELVDDFTVLGDQHKMFIVFRTSHNGSSRLRADLSPIRMNCFNQNALITKTAEASWGITHALNHDLQEQEAQKAFGLAANYEHAYADLAAKLNSIEMTPDRATKILTVSMDKRAKVATVIRDAHVNWLSSPTINEAQRMTGWGLLNGVTEYMDHVIRRDNAAATFEATMNGEGARVRNRLVTNMLRLAA